MTDSTNGKGTHMNAYRLPAVVALGTMVWLLVLVSMARASDPGLAPCGGGRAGQVTPQQRLLSKRAAQVDGYRMLAEQILGFSLTSDTAVRDLVSRDDRVRTELNTLVRGARFSEPRYNRDGSCEIDATVTFESVVTTLARTTTKTLDGGAFRSDTFRSLNSRTVDSDVTVTSAGAAAASEGPGDVPDPATASVPLLDPAGRAQPDLPPVFAQYPANRRLMARRAAEVDAYRLLLEQVYGLRLTSGTTVGDLVARDDEIRAHAEGYVRGARTTDVRYEPDGTVRVQKEVAVDQVVTIVRRSSDEVVRDGAAERHERSDVSQQDERKVIAVVGTGVLAPNLPAPQPVEANAERTERTERTEVERRSTTDPLNP